MVKEISPKDVVLGEEYKPDPKRRGRGPAKPPPTTKDLLLEDIKDNIKLSKTVRNMLEKHLKWSEKAIEQITTPADKLDVLNKLAVLAATLAKISESLSKVANSAGSGLDNSLPPNSDAALKMMNTEFIGGANNE